MWHLGIYKIRLALLLLREKAKLILSYREEIPYKVVRMMWWELWISVWRNNMLLVTQQKRMSALNGALIFRVKRERQDERAE